MSKYFTYIVKYSGGKRTISKLNTTEDIPLCQWERKKENTSKNKKILKTNTLKSNTKELKNNNDMETKV